MADEREQDDHEPLPEAPMPLCPTHLDRACSAEGLFIHSDSAPCPLCSRSTYGSFLLCGHCATEVGVCVFDALPLDGSSSEPPLWLASLETDKQAARDAIPRPSPGDVHRIQQARHLFGTWSNDARRGPDAGSDHYLVLGADFTGLLAFFNWGQLGELSRFRWSLDGDLFTATPWSLAAVPEGAWEELLEISPTRVEVRADRPELDEPIWSLRFPNEPGALRTAGWLFGRLDPMQEIDQRLRAILRETG